MKKKLIALIITMMMTTLTGCGEVADTVIDNTEVSEAITEMTEVIDKIADATEDVIGTENTETAETEIDATEVVADEDEVAEDVAEDTANDNKSDKTDTQTTDNKSNDKKTEDKPAENAEKTPAKDDKKPAETPAEKPAENKPVHTHSYTGKVTKNATCANTGVKTYTCSCGATYTEDIAKTAHQYDNGTMTKAPTCNTEGVMTYTCGCGATYTEKIGVGSHTYAHHDAEYKTVTVVVQEAWDEDQYEGHAICNGCGKDFGAGTAGADAVGLHIATDFFDDCENYRAEKVKVGTKHHDAVTETRQELVSEAYDECTTCGHKK